MSPPDLPSRPDFPPFLFPSVAIATTAVALPFASYPERLGWSVTTDSWLLNTGIKPSHEQFVAFFQTWLFFGTIAEISDIFSLDIDIEKEFVVPSSVAGKWLSTAPLTVLRARCLAAHGQLDPTRARERETRLSDCREIVLRELHKRGTVLGERPRSTKDQSRIYQALDTLLRVLALMEQSPRKVSVYDDLTLYFATLQEMPGMGWCPSEVRMVSMHMNSRVAFMASGLERPLMFREHVGCDDERCLADQVEEENYETAHVEAGCRCEFAGVQGEALSEILGRGKVPRISLSGVSDEEGRFELEVVEDAPYLAISHVWAHGMGNHYENALPRCQLLRLKGYVDHLSAMYSFSQPLALWIDTLCIPVQLTLRKFRSIGIQLLATTYKNAALMLVLDRELQAVSVWKSLLELSIRVLCSGWLRRLWTLQEASLIPGSKIHFQMAENQQLRYNELMGFLSTNPPATEIEKVEASLRLYETVATQIYQRILPMEALQGRNMSVAEQEEADSKLIHRVSGAVKYRSTSKDEDEPVCIASLLNLPLSKILATRTAHARMGIFYTLMRHMPAEILFSPSPKLSQRPFRWAPKSLVHDNFNFHQIDTHDKNVGRCDDRGFHVYFDIAVLSPHSSASDTTMYSEDATMNSCIVIDTSTGEEYALAGTRSFPPFKLSLKERPFTVPKTRAGLMFQEPVRKRPARDVWALIVEIEEIIGGEEEESKGEEEYVVTIVDHAFLSLWSEWAPWNPVRGPEGESVKPAVLFGAHLAREQACCVT